MTTEPTYTGKWGGEALPEDKDRAGVFPAPFGSYVLLHRLARGGMGNVFLAKTGGVAGIEKHCVVKTLRDRYCNDAEYVQQFMEEARVVVQLSHRNICPVFDVGRVGDNYYLAMELIIGQDVRKLTSALEHRGRSLSEACGLHIACEMLDALDYAHRHVDTATGEPLHLVHRDVSPQNVMISVEGEVKLIDFGLAERDRDVSDEHHSTGTGLVMGKMAYMPPEQARGEIVDPRADQFAAAVVIYELVAGTRYYEGMSQRQIWEHAGIGDIRPAGLSQLHPDLKAILERALAPERVDRYPTTGDFREALLGYTRAHNLHAGARDLRALVAELFDRELRETRELLRRFAHLSGKARARAAVAATLPAAGPLGEGAAANAEAPAHGPERVMSIARGAAEAEIHDPTEMFQASPHMAEISQPAPVRRPRSWAAAAVAAVAIVVVALGGVLWRESSARAPEVVAVPIPDASRTTQPGPVATPSTHAQTNPAVPAPTEAPPTTQVIVADGAPGVDVPAANPAPTQLGNEAPNVDGATADPSKSPNRKRKPDPRARPETPPVGVPKRVDYIKRTCPKLACAAPIIAVVNEKRIATVDPVAFAAEVNACFEACWRR